MAVHNAKTKSSAKKQAMRYRDKGFNATISKTKMRGWSVYTSRK